MIRQSPAQIFLSDKRRIRQSDSHRSFSTFSYGAHENTHKFNLSKLFVLNDEELAGAGSVKIQIRQASYMILIPITGDLLISRPETGETRIMVGEIKVISLPRTTSITLINPYPDEVINYMQLCIKPDRYLDLSATYQFDLDKNDNELIRFCAPMTTFSISIGRFKGRSEGLYQLRNTNSKVFCFVISGAFEVEHRLLQMRDGLALSGIEELDFEALSENAVLLMIELFGGR